MEGLIKGHDNQVKGAHVKVAKTNAVVQRPVSRLYKIEGKEEKVNSDTLNKDNVNTDSDHSANTRNRPKREAAIIGEIKTQIHKVILPRRKCLNIISLLRYFITCFLCENLFLYAHAYSFN